MSTRTLVLVALCVCVVCAVVHGKEGENKDKSVPLTHPTTLELVPPSLHQQGMEHNGNPSLSIQDEQTLENKVMQNIQTIFKAIADARDREREMLPLTQHDDSDLIPQFGMGLPFPNAFQSNDMEDIQRSIFENEPDLRFEGTQGSILQPMRGEDEGGMRFALMFRSLPVVQQYSLRGMDLNRQERSDLDDTDMLPSQLDSVVDEPGEEVCEIDWGSICNIEREDPITNLQCLKEHLSSFSPACVNSIKQSIYGYCEDEISTMCPTVHHKKGLHGLYRCLHKHRNEVGDACAGYLHLQKHSKHAHPNSKSPSRKDGFIEQDAAVRDNAPQSTPTATTTSPKHDELKMEDVSTSSLPLDHGTRLKVIVGVVIAVVGAVIVLTYFIVVRARRHGDETYRLMMV